MNTNTTNIEIEEIYQCANKKCRWEGTMEQKKEKRISKYLTGHFCPKCGKDEFYRLPQQRMRQLNDTPEDRKFLHKLLSEGKLPKVAFTVTINCFTSILASSLTKFEYKGEITSVDLESGYCEWRNEKGYKMSPIKISCIAIHL